MRIPRNAASTVKSLASEFPAVAITGPRQSGKTTLARAVFANKPYVSLEDLDERAFADDDPRGFLNRFPDGAILDEVQRAPTLFSYLQTRLDESRETGQFILTGSQQFNLLSGVTQSLAGRVALVNLLPFSLGELQQAERAPEEINQLLFRGLYPPVHDRVQDAQAWYANYVRTYVERDVRQLLQIRDLHTFQLFVRLCAGRTGQLLNLSDLANDCGISHATARAWISVLEASFIIHLLPPHHKNFSKRIVKTPKLYFIDTGLACHLIGIEEVDQLTTHPMRGSLFETWVVAEIMKRRTNDAKESNLYFWRDRTGNEIDILVDRPDGLVPIEVKSGQTIASDFDRGLKRWKTLAGNEAHSGWVIYGGEASMERRDTRYVAWRDLPNSGSVL